MKKEERIARARVELEKNVQAQIDKFTVEDLCRTYLSDCIENHRTKKSAREARRALYADPVKILGHMPAAEVTASQIYGMILGIVERGAKVQAGFVLREFTAAFDRAIGDTLPEEHVNPCYHAKAKFKLKRVKLTNGRGTRVFGDSELVTFLKWLPESRFTPGQKNVLQLTMLTGCRTGEVCMLRWSDLDLYRGIWHLKVTKSGVPRDVQLSIQAINLIGDRIQRDSPYVFHQRAGGPVNQKTISEMTWRMRREGHLPLLAPWTPHDVRRTVRTGLARLGCPTEVAEAVLGHAPKGIEGVYNLHRYEGECRRWLQKWCDHLDVLNNSGDQIIEMMGRHHG